MLLTIYEWRRVSYAAEGNTPDKEVAIPLSDDFAFLENAQKYSGFGPMEYRAQFGEQRKWEPQGESGCSVEF